MLFHHKKIAVALLGVSLLATSCKKWLDVRPKTEMPADVMFTTESGFQDALTGVYINMKSTRAYGESLTYGTVERLTSSWDVTTNTTEQFLGLFRYEEANVQERFESIYGQLYKVIAETNAILDVIDARKNVFRTEGGFEMIKGECLAIRAYCHLDLLRLFGPVPTEVSATPVLPYVKRLSKEPNQHLTVEQFKTELMKDLTDAAALLKDVDPFTKYSQTELSNPGNPSYTAFNPQTTYAAFRFLRMNYYAVKALQARAHLWFQDKNEAYAAAMEVINAQNPNGAQKFRLGVSSDMTAGDLNLSVEHIFGLYDFQMATKFANHFTSGSLKKGSAVTTVNSQLYGNTGTDIREVNLWELITLANGSKCYILKKYRGPVSTGTSTPYPIGGYQVPMLRASEMYLIAIETAPTAEAQQLWDAFRTSRNIPVVTLPGDYTALQRELIKEYRKELFAEGQAFFAYKRINAPKSNFLWAPSAATVNYIVPLPLTEFVK